MSKYEDRITQRFCELSDCNIGLACLYPETFKEMAQLSVQREAEVLTEWMDSYAWTLEGKQEYLISRGLIPPPNETI